MGPAISYFQTKASNFRLQSTDTAVHFFALGLVVIVPTKNKQGEYCNGEDFWQRLRIDAGLSRTSICHLLLLSFKIQSAVYTPFIIWQISGDKGAENRQRGDGGFSKFLHKW